MRGNRNILTQKLQIVKTGARRLKNTKFYALLITLTVLVGTLCLSPAISSLMNSVIIGNNGQISIPTITAASGYWRDIQNAVDWIVAHGGIGNVYIPAGVWNFVNVGESWTGARVVIPAGVNLFGAPTERTSGLSYDGVGQNPNDQVVEWRTVLRLPWDAPSATWFLINGSGDPNKPSRFSDIKLVGYRSVNSSSTTMHIGVGVQCVIDFRVDHCYFEHICGGGVSVSGDLNGNTWAYAPSRGVIDHCFFVNTYGHVESNIDQCTVIYGVEVYKGTHEVSWEDDITNVLGKYTSYTVYIEDSYFSGWRHCVSSNTGAHYVFRHNTVKDDFGFGSIDAHGWFSTECNNPQHGRVFNPPAVWNGTMWVCGYSVPGNPGGICGCPLNYTGHTSGAYYFVSQVGTRAVEIYSNLIVNATESPWATMIRGGAGVAFNNRVGGGTYTSFIYLTNEARDNPEGSMVWCHDWYVWNNKMLPGMTEIIEYDPNNNITEGEDYFRYAPSWYTPYPYPHPLTLEATP
jgi:hypothetical protein